VSDYRRATSILAAELAARIDRVLPAGFISTSTETEVALFVGDGHQLRTIDILPEKWDEEDFRDAAVRSVLQVLHDFQDDVIEELWEAWPISAGRVAPAEPYARVDGNVLRTGYGYGTLRVMDLEPIDISAFP